MKKLCIFVVLILAGMFKTWAQTTIPAKEAAKHIGETVTVTDKLFGGKLIANSNMTLLDIGGYNPNQALTIMIPGASRSKFKGAPEVDFKGKTISVTGKLMDYKGKPEIIVEDPAQLKLAPADTAGTKP